MKALQGWIAAIITIIAAVGAALVLASMNWDSNPQTGCQKVVSQTLATSVSVTDNGQNIVIHSIKLCLTASQAEVLKPDMATKLMRQSASYIETVMSSYEGEMELPTLQTDVNAYFQSQVSPEIWGKFGNGTIRLAKE